MLRRGVRQHDLVGAYHEDSGATTIDGDQTDNSAVSSGAVHVIVRNGDEWHRQACFKPSNSKAYDSFGYSVAISGDSLIVGTPGKGSLVGAAHVFRRIGTSWYQEAQLKGSNTASSHQFGNAVAISGDTVIVGALSESSDAVGVNGVPLGGYVPGSGDRKSVV